MQIVINIPEEYYKIRGGIENGSIVSKMILNSLKKGIPLPKGHGRLIDADETLSLAWQNFYKHEDEWERKDSDYIPVHRFYSQNGFECCQQTVVNALTIIDANKEGKNGD